MIQCKDCKHFWVESETCRINPPTLVNIQAIVIGVDSTVSTSKTGADAWPTTGPYQGCSHGES